MTSMMSYDAFTISSNNYLGMARVFAESYIEHHPGTRVFVCLVDRPSDLVDYREFPFELVCAEDLEIPGFRNFAFRYDILELNTAVKPFFFKYLRDVVGLDRAFYFDPDILVYDRLSVLEDAIRSHQAVLTPHLLRPIDNTARPTERSIRACGVYNLGFLGLQLGRGTEGFLEWWCERLHRFCVVDLEHGLFVDQSWMDFAPAFLESVAIVRDPRFNVAYWNLPHRHPVFVEDRWEIDGQRVGFFHFSGVDFDNLSVVSRHQDRFDLWTRPELRPLFEGYRELVASSGQHRVAEIPYSYREFSGTDTVIPRGARVAAREVDPSGIRWPDPFVSHAADDFLSWYAEPFRVGDAWVNRACLYLWQERPDVHSTFPDLRGGDLHRFLEWYVNWGAEAAGLHDAFVEPVRRHLHTDRVSVDEELIAISRIDLRVPGSDTAWLNQPVDAGRRPILTRLTLAVHRCRTDIRGLYPDPLGSHRRLFAHWFVTHGAVEHGLHDDLVEPVRRSLPLRSRLAFAVRRRGQAVTQVNARSSRLDIGLDEPRGSARPATDGLIDEPHIVGVNVVGFFEGDRGAFSFATEIAETLSESGMTTLQVPLDHQHGSRLSPGWPLGNDGTPYPITILAVPTEYVAWAIRYLPLGTLWGGRIAAWCADVCRDLDTAWFRSVDEIWVPDERLAVIARRMGTPVVVVPPPAMHPVAAPGHEDPDLPSGVEWYLIVDRSDDSKSSSRILAGANAFRRATAGVSEPVGLCIVTAHGTRLPMDELRDLNLRVVTRPMSPALRSKMISCCAGFVDVRQEQSPDPFVLEARAKRLAMVNVPLPETTGSELDSPSKPWIDPRSEGRAGGPILDWRTAVRQLAAKAPGTVISSGRA